jgi:hypothetical protein
MKRIALVVSGVLLVAGIAEARTSTSALGDGSEYQAMIGLDGRHEVPYTDTPPVIDGTMDAGEWDAYFYTFFGPSTLAQWAEQVGYKKNEPGQVVADGLVSQLTGHEGEDASDVATDADSFTNTWQCWDDEYIYIAVNVIDNVYDVSGSQDGGYWERDGFFHEIDFLESPSVADAGGNLTALAFSAIAMEEQRYSVTAWAAGLEGTPTIFYGDAPDAFLGTGHAFSLTDEGHIIETRSSWAFMARYLDNFQPYDGWEFGNSYHILDPDGGEGYGGQFQYGRDGDAGNVAGWATWILTGGSGAPTAVESTTWGAVKASW